MALFRRKFTRAYSSALSKEEQLRFLNLLHRLLTTGYSIIDALHILSLNNQFYETANRISGALKNGKTIDEAFELTNFHPTIVSFLYFTKISGDIIENIEKCRNFFQQQLKYTKKFHHVIRYPLILITFFLILLFFIRGSVLPSFQEMFQGHLSSISSIHLTFHIIDFLTTFFMTIFLLSGIIVFMWKKFQHFLSVEEKIKFYQWLPIVRGLLTITNSFYFATHFSTLLKAGFSVKEILTNMKTQKKLPVISFYADIMIDELSNGVDLSYIIHQFPLLDKKLTVLFQSKTDYSSLQKDLSVYAEMLMEEIEYKMMKFLTLLQPVILVVIAILIIFMYASIMWPLFQLIKTI
ncbi:MAG TPA: competence type IV pilus assembly protein ComGB [Bacillota bacterium]|nr:competence type IV pilus assembly protein ComGB [Compostibacillus humi]HLT56991.1 competence type IV pilus assembly protein ComGB [Bacillota bacterium]